MIIRQRCTALLTILWMMAAVTGCFDQHPMDSGDILIRIGDRVATMDDFNRVLEVAESAYSRSTMKDPLVFREMRVGVLNQLIEEMILLEAAETHDIKIADAEVETAVGKLKADYPEGVFERMFLENAVSYESWKERLRLRLLAEKIAEKVLRSRIVISSEDISAYYRKHYSKNNHKPGDISIDAEITEGIVEHIRREKVEKAYTAWLENLKSQLPIEVNQEQWTKIIEENAGSGIEKQAKYQMAQ